MNPNQKVNLGPLWIFLGCLCASTCGTTQAFAPAGATPLSIGGVRLLSGGLFLLLANAVQSNLPKLSGLPKGRILLATLGLIVYQLCFFKGCKLTGVAVGSVVAIGVVPIAVGVIGWILLKERPTQIWYVATLIMLVGLLALGLSDSNANIELDKEGILLAVTAGIGYSFFMVLIKPVLNSHGASQIMNVVFLLGGFLMLPIILSLPMAWMFTVRGMICIFNWGALTAALSFSLILYGMRTTSAPVCGTLAVSEPLCAAVWGICLLGEQVSQQGYIGMVLILVSTLVLVKPQKEIEKPLAVPN
jgi:DME family drug/metabolite transporter